MRKNSLRTSLKTTFPRLAKNIRNFGLVGFIFLWIRYENLPYLSMRFLFLLYLIWIVAYIGHNVYKFKTKLPEAIDKQHSTKKLKNYLPTKKKKGGKKKRK
ncbi:MAG: hypothetical protein Q8P27_01140, partial [Candidatus Peregrinibacteria bacterium]|nr:hypothetical protein [Candidatus Peregrinibacteria bacterium]